MKMKMKMKTIEIGIHLCQPGNEQIGLPGSFDAVCYWCHPVPFT